ncbi:MAG: alpha/beta hydrolase [Proteobacteria bacterium]|nr:alpha/beta hydrolase [Pseudomonadota bacterium]
MKQLPLAVVTVSLGILVGCSGGHNSLLDSSSVPFVNNAIVRDLLNNDFSEEYRDDLMNIKKKCESVASLKMIAEMPIDHFSDLSETFKYYYGHDIKDAENPTIVFIPGGPGGGSIRSIFPIESYNLLKIDPRGVDCNYGTDQDIPLENLNTIQHVMDILAVIKHEGLKNYVIYGKSYGTEVATILADAIQNLPVNPPRGVILEGVIGKAYAEPDSWTQGFANVANSFLDENNSIREFFKSDPDPLDIPTAFWTSYISLASDEWEDRREKLMDLSESLKSGHEKNGVISYFREKGRDFEDRSESSEPEEIPNDYVLYNISCKELSGQMCGRRYNLVFDNGLVVTNPADQLFSPQKYQNIELSSPYDSAKYKIQVPLYYFQGTADPATPLSGALYHFENQERFRSAVLNNKPLVFQKFRYRGHSPLMDIMRENFSCWSKLFEAMFDGRTDLGDVVSHDGYCK